MMQNSEAEKVLQNYYEQYRHELDGIWRNSAYLWGFVSILFTGYGIILSQMIGNTNTPESLCAYNILSSAITLLGLCASAFWIAFAKSSRTWQEYYEAYISSLENDRRFFKLPRKYAMGGSTNRIRNLDYKLTTHNNGSFSLGKLNILLAQCIWAVWCILFLFHRCIAFKLETMPILLTFGLLLAYIIVVYAIRRLGRKTYLRNEDFGEEYLFELYCRVEQAESELDNSGTSTTGTELLAFFENYYNALGYDLYNAFKNTIGPSDYKDWLKISYSRLYADFRIQYVDGLNDNQIQYFLTEIRNQFEIQKDLLRREIHIGK